MKEIKRIKNLNNTITFILWHKFVEFINWTGLEMEIFIPLSH